MEVYRGTVPTVTFKHPTSDTVVSAIEYSVNGAAALTAAPIAGPGQTSAKLGYLQTDGEVKITWTFTIPSTGVFSETQYYDIVTPLLFLDEVKTITGMEDEEATAIERSVRHIINAHTGQSFGRFVGTKSVTGSGESYLRLPDRLISFNSINSSVEWKQTIALRGDGWYIQSKNLGIPTIRADFDGWHEQPWTSTVPIVPPYAKQFYTFLANEEYVIDGVWGWDSVPSPVQEATRLLVNDYASEDSIYRDRFLSGITAADWHIQFNDGAFSDTGNVRANQLLSGYVLRRGWTVI